MLLFVAELGGIVLLCVDDTDSEGDTDVRPLPISKDRRNWLFQGLKFHGEFVTVYYEDNTDIMDAVADVFKDRLRAEGKCK
jgi:hypothetical protein